MCDHCRNKSWCICEEHMHCLLFRKSKNCVCCEWQEYIIQKQKETKSTMNYRCLIRQMTKNFIKFYKQEKSNKTQYVNNM